MELQDAQKLMLSYMNEAADQFQKVPGSAMLIRYIRSSYQNDPVRSAIELILVVFFVRYLLAPSYSTHRQNFVTLSEEVCEALRQGGEEANRRIRRLMIWWKNGPLNRWLHH